MFTIIWNIYKKIYRGSRPVASSGKPANNTKTVAFDLPPWQNQSSENGDTKIEVSIFILLFQFHFFKYNILF